MFSIATSTLFALLALVASPALAANPTQGGKYTISPKSHPELCVAPEYEHEGALLVLKKCDDNSDIVWTWQGGNQWKNTAINMVFDVKDGGAWNGNKIQVWTGYGYNTNQQFILPNEQIEWAGRNLCLDLTDGRGAVGTTLQLWQCLSYNDNQKWEFVDAEEIEECADGYVPVSSSKSPASSATASPTASNSSAAYPTASASANSTIPAPSASANATDIAISGSASQIGNGFLAGGQSSSTRSGKKSSSSAWSASATASATSAWSATSAGASPAATSASSGGYTFSGSMLKTQGTKIVDASGKQVVLKGTNLGGWLVFEDWMCGITDYSGNADRFPQWTLETRFGEKQTKELMNIWMDNWLVASDWDKLKALGFNVVRLPFSYRNFQNMDGSWSDDGFTRLDWAFNQAKRVGIYVIPVFHIWDTQKQRYSMISENNWDGQQSRQRAGEMWKKIASRYANEAIIAAWDLINEPTGSANDNLQKDLYNAVRSVDSNHILIQASIGTNPSQYGWTNVIYTMHEYLMMEGNLNSNKPAYANGPAASISAWNAMNIPTYVGEFMADGDTLTYMLEQLNNAGVWWSSWTIKTVQMDRWGLFNFSNNMRVDVSNDSYDAIKSKWSNMGGLTRQAVADQYQKAAGGWRKRDVPSVRVGEERSLRTSGHGGRSRRAVAHGGIGAKF